MRKIVVSEFVSLDNVIQAPGEAEEDTEGGFTYGGWTGPFWFFALLKHANLQKSEGKSEIGSRFSRSLWPN